MGANDYQKVLTKKQQALIVNISLLKQIPNIYRMSLLLSINSKYYEVLTHSLSTSQSIFLLLQIMKRFNRFTKTFQATKPPMFTDDVASLSSYLNLHKPQIKLNTTKEQLYIIKGYWNTFLIELFSEHIYMQKATDLIMFTKLQANTHTNNLN